MFVLRDPKRALAIASEAWEEFSDLEQTPAGVELMGRSAWAYLSLDDTAGAMPWFDRLLPIAERLGLLEATADGIHGRGVSLLDDGPAPGGHGPPARGPPARGRERPARQSNSRPVST